MFRTLLALTALLAAAPLAAAQQREPGDPLPLTLSPARPASPALKYRLVPDSRDQVAGNAAAVYYRCMTRLVENATLHEEVANGVWNTWRTLPLAELPLDEVRAKLEVVGPVLRMLDEAARCRYCDWLLDDRTEGYFLLIPEVGLLRQALPVLVVRARYELALGHEAEAVRALQAGYVLGHHLGRGTTFIHLLVGAVVPALQDPVLEEILQRPRMPNLYWALTVLPHPYLDMNSATRFEWLSLERTFPGLKQLEEGPMTPKQVRALQEDIGDMLGKLDLRKPNLAEVVAQAWLQARAYPEARKVLLAEGVPAEQVAAMPVTQVVALDVLHRYRAAWDDTVPWLNVPDFRHAPGYRQASERLDRAAREMNRLLFFAGAGLRRPDIGPPQFDRIYNAVGRTERRFAALRCVEALRLYAAGHGGKLPASLKDVTEVPVPVDPVTDRPFEYQARGDAARLVAPLQDGDKTPKFERLTYEITLRR
jgi:hypothetical protein